MGTIAYVLLTLLGMIALVFKLERGARMSQRWSGVCAAACGALLVSLVWSSWGVGRVSEQRYYFEGSDVPIFGWVAVGLGLAVVVLGLFAALGRLHFSPLTTAPAIVMLFFTALFIVVTETISRLIPSFIVPKTVRRLTVDIGAGHGAWLALLVASFAVVCLCGRLPEWAERTVEWSSELLRRPLRLCMYGLLVTSVGALTASRYMSWIKIDALEGSAGIAGWAAPFVGPSTLLAVLFTYAGLGVFFLKHRLGGLIVVGLSCSYLATTATVSHATNLIFDGSVTADLIARFVGIVGGEASIERGLGPLAMFLAAIAVVSSLSLICGDESYE